MTSLSPEDIRAISIIDVDQTLIEGEMDEVWKGESWLLLTAAFGANIDKHIKIFTEFRNKINGNHNEDNKTHDEMAQRLISLWEESRGELITRNHLEVVCDYIKTRISEEAQLAIAELISNGILVIIATGGFENAAQAIAHLLKLHEVVIEGVNSSNLDMWFGNTEFIFNEDDILIGFHHKKDVIGHKRTQAIKKIKEIIDLLGLDKNIPVIPIGDGKSDLGLFLEYPGIAYKPTSGDLRMAAQAIAEDWSQIVSQALAYVKQTENKISSDEANL